MYTVTLSDLVFGHFGENWSSLFGLWALMLHACCQGTLKLPPFSHRLAKREGSCEGRTSGSHDMQVRKPINPACHASSSSDTQAWHQQVQHIISGSVHACSGDRTAWINQQCFDELYPGRRLPDIKRRPNNLGEAGWRFEAMNSETMWNYAG